MSTVEAGRIKRNGTTLTRLQASKASSRNGME
jgi:hypothetical protein